jgi:TonB family protein
MREVKWTLVLLAFTTAGVWAQGSSDWNQPYHQTPDTDGVYFVGPEVAAPTLVNAVPAVYTDDMLKSDKKGISVWSMVIGADGAPVNIHLFQPLGVAFDTAAIEAIKQCTFAPGRLRGEPVAVHIGVAVPFHYGKYPSVPVVAILEKDLDPSGSGSPAHKKPKVRCPTNSDPVLIHTVEPIFSSDAIKAMYQGVVLLSALVGVDGSTSDVRVVRALGMGLDEKAVEAVQRYRYKPAIKDGKPVPMRITLEVNFRIY